MRHQKCGSNGRQSPHERLRAVSNQSGDRLVVFGDGVQAVAVGSPTMDSVRGSGSEEAAKPSGQP
jgi:sulfur transfer complex TusBCD TusB component (DsrH family)